ncbi:DUF302 domain-containing protein [Mucilaginibacter kameinonensis]|uniref:DUF302 domain-containing protein n=1 Tax=Mucilaginibacter kameinonensis TaxID=452286 RepID=UPI000EF7C9F7|nr:DUF302 domain-containing protein [Mucilaginibacter kameinonensis]
MNPTGVIIRQTVYTVKEVIDRLENALKQKGITIYARIDQQAEALKGGINLPPFEFLLFGNPAKGGLIMEFNPATALDLPLKVIAWKNGEDKTWVAYNDPDFIKQRYSLTDQLTAILDIGPIVTAILQH